MLHNVKKGVHFVNESCSFFVQFFFFWLSSIPLVIVMRLVERFWHFFHKHIKTLCVIIGQVQIQAFFA